MSMGGFKQPAVSPCTVNHTKPSFTFSYVPFQAFQDYIPPPPPEPGGPPRPGGLLPPAPPEGLLPPPRGGRWAEARGRRAAAAATTKMAKAAIRSMTGEKGQGELLKCPFRSAKWLGRI